MPNIEEDLSLAGLRDSINDKLATKVNMQQGKGLSTNDFNNKYKNDLENLVEINKTTPPVPTTTQPGLTLKSTNVSGVYNWEEIEPYDHSKMTSVDRQIHLSAEDKMKLEQMVTIQFITSNYYNKGEVISEVYNIINSYTNASSLLSTIAQINNALASKVNANDTTGQNLTLAQYLKDEMDNKVDKIDGKGLSTNDFTNDYKLKLDRYQEYVLPKASETELGGVKVGYGVKTDKDGRLSVDTENIATKADLQSITEYQLPRATTSTLGGVKIGNGLIMDSNGAINLDTNQLSISLQSVNAALANKLNKAAIEFGYSNFGGNNGTIPASITSTSGKKIKFCVITPVSNSLNSIDFGNYWCSISNNQVLVYNTGIDGPQFAYMLILED